MWSQYGMANDSQLAMIQLVDMAQKGFIEIDKEDYPDKVNSVYFIFKTNKQAQTPEEERFNKSFPNEVVLDGKYDSKFGKYVRTFSARQLRQYEKDAAYNGLWIFLALVVFIGLLYCTPRPLEYTNVVAFLLLIFSGASLCATGFRRLLIFLLFVSIGIGSVAQYKTGMSFFTGGLSWQMVVCLLVVIMLPIFSKAMRQPSKSGSKKLAKAKGLELFLKTVDFKTPAGFTKEKAEALYPYALALGLGDEWENRFKTLIGAALIDPTIYNHQFRSSLHSGIRSGSTSPQSNNSSGGGSSHSGSSGGGCSGGGGGGGGGGGW